MRQCGEPPATPGIARRAKNAMLKEHQPLTLSIGGRVAETFHCLLQLGRLGMSVLLSGFEAGTTRWVFRAEAAPRINISHEKRPQIRAACPRHILLLRRGRNIGVGQTKDLRRGQNTAGGSRCLTRTQSDCRAGEYQQARTHDARPTLRIRDPAPLILDSQPESHGRVCGIWLVRLLCHVAVSAALSGDATTPPRRSDTPKPERWR